MDGVRTVLDWVQSYSPVDRIEIYIGLSIVIMGFMVAFPILFDGRRPLRETPLRRSKRISARAKHHNE